jgi:GAF domain-containing protein
MAKSVATSLAPAVHELLSAGGKIEPSALAPLAEVIRKAFHLQPDEVAILIVAQQGRFLKFLYPEKLHGIGQIPLTSTSALAARTAREKRPELINHFTVVRHASVFEAVPLQEERSEPIQKIMSVPIVLDEKAIGVIQVSRKGRSLAEAGADFVPGDLQELIAAAEAIAPCIQLCIPD